MGNGGFMTTLTTCSRSEAHIPPCNVTPFLPTCAGGCGSRGSPSCYYLPTLKFSHFPPTLVQVGVVHLDPPAAVVTAALRGGTRQAHPTGMNEWMWGSVREGWLLQAPLSRTMQGCPVPLPAPPFSITSISAPPPPPPLAVPGCHLPSEPVLLAAHLAAVTEGGRAPGRLGHAKGPAQGAGGRCGVDE